MSPDLKDSIDAEAFEAARTAAPDIPEDRLRVALAAYTATFHVVVRHVHAERELTPDEVLDAFRPRTVEF